MREILSLSLPKMTVAEVKRRAKKRGFKSASEYVRYLVDLDEGLISPEQLLVMSKRADKEYRAGKLKEYKSLSKIL